MSTTIRLLVEDFLQQRDVIPVVDVRSPGEFAKGHILNAINIPLFSDEERSIVGTTYKKEGRDAAIQIGLDIVGPQMSQKVRLAQELAKNRKLLLYCWRGGMRSSSMAWLFNQVGIETKVLIGGYKSYRREAQKSFAKSYKIIVLGGMTGSGKTSILNELKILGEQVVDLEGIANHKGSAFGGIGKNTQPTTEHFENILFEHLMGIDPSQNLWLEDESHSIGSVFIPLPLFQQMQNGYTIAIERPIVERVNRIEREYASLSSASLVDAVKRISKRLGGDNTKLCIESIEREEFRPAIEICLGYYDKTYRYGLENHKQGKFIIQLQEDDPVNDAKKILAYASKI